MIDLHQAQERKNNMFLMCLSADEGNFRVLVYFLSGISVFTTLLAVLLFFSVRMMAKRNSFLSSGICSCLFQSPFYSHTQLLNKELFLFHNQSVNQDVHRPLQLRQR